MMAWTVEKLRGSVKALKKTEGFGFIIHKATGDEYFFHRSELDRATTWENLKLYQEVEFEPVEGPKGARAMKVRCV
jgi:cold shock CspA family protein